MKTWEKLHRIADSARPALKQDFLKAISKVAGAVDQKALAKAIKTGNQGAAWKAINWEKTVQAEMTPAIKKVLADIMAESGTVVLRDLLQVDQDLFHPENPQVYGYINKEVGDLITHVTQQTRNGVKIAVREAYLRGLAPPKDQIFTILQEAANIRESLGLNQRQMGALNNYRTNLRQQNLPASKYTNLVNRYRERLLKERAETIARTETINTAVEGQNQAWQQGVQQGLIKPVEFEIEWLVTPDDVTCKRCLTMKGKRRPIGQPYTSGKAAGKFGPTLHPRCRCTETLVRKRKRGVA